VITAQGLELRAGARLLLLDASFQVGPGDRVGLVGRNGAGKTTLTRVLAGEADPAAGAVRRTGTVGYLPQDPRTGDLGILARDRILGARGLDEAARTMRSAAERMGDDDPDIRERAMRGYDRATAQFEALGGYAADAEAARIAASLGLPERVLGQEIGTLSGGQRRRVELARILFGDYDVLLLDEPTNHLDVISHDVGLLEATVNTVLHLDAQRSVLDTYAMGWSAYLQQRETDERRRRRERANAERQAGALREQAERMRAKATKARAAQSMLKRADRIVRSLEEARASDRVAKIRLPDPAPCGKTPLSATGLSRSYGSEEVFTDVDLTVDRGSRVVVLGLNGAGKTTLLRILAGVDEADTGEVIHGHGARVGYYAQEHETLDPERTVLETFASAAPDMSESDRRSVLGSFLFGGDDVTKPVRVLSGGEKTRLALATLVVSSANVLLLDEPTNNLDPASRDEILAALRGYRGAVVLVTHDEGAVRALDPQRVVILPEGDEDLWNDDYAELVELA
jgi:ATPase subunit of ABC transporter with duplicated ATPase domains